MLCSLTRAQHSIPIVSLAPLIPLLPRATAHHMAPGTYLSTVKGQGTV